MTSCTSPSDQRQHFPKSITPGAASSIHLENPTVPMFPPSNMLSWRPLCTSGHPPSRKALPTSKPYLSNQVPSPWSLVPNSWHWHSFHTSGQSCKYRQNQCFEFQNLPRTALPDSLSRLCPLPQGNSSRVEETAPQWRAIDTSVSGIN